MPDSLREDTFDLQLLYMCYHLRLSACVSFQYNLMVIRLVMVNGFLILHYGQYHLMIVNVILD